MFFDANLSELIVPEDIGDEIFALAADIFPICRSLTGDGVRETLRRLDQHIPVEIHEVPSGAEAFDWTVPREWNIRDAYIKNVRGEKIVDFAASNLHVMGYSVPVRKRVSLDELKKHLHTIPDQPDLIPYRTSYYVEDWGFCLPHSQYEKLADEIYEVVINSTLENGSLTYGESLIEGATEDEILLCTHICHPSLANEGCSSLALMTQLAKRLSTQKTRYSYRFLFTPSTIGTIAWLSRNESRVSRIKHGLVLANLGDGAPPVYKKSRRGDAEVDRASAHVLEHSGLAPIFSISSPTAMTSGNSARRDSTCRSGFCSAACSASFPSIIRRPTISNISRASIWRIPTAWSPAFSMSWRTTPST